MFGYVTIDPSTLSKDAKKRYSAYYCGLCRTLKTRYGNFGRLTLSNDMTFLTILLCSLYEPDELMVSGFCPMHPTKKRDMLLTPFSDYIADMNIALAYYKGLDDWRDDRSAAGLIEVRTLKTAYSQVQKRHPEKCEAIRACLDRIGEMEKRDTGAVDELANQSAIMLGEIYAVKNDYWEGALRAMGEALGRFIYLMDAYEDLPKDVRKKRFNPLKELKAEEQYELLCKDSLAMLISECTEAFELMPLQRDVDILRNILYAGVWTRYNKIRQKALRKSKDKLTETEAHP